MNPKDKLARMNKLLEVYGKLLTKTQLKIMKDKYEYDLSLQEISEHYHISRAGALDAIKVASNKLEEFESALMLLEKQNKILKQIKDPKLKEKIKTIF